MNEAKWVSTLLELSFVCLFFSLMTKDRTMDKYQRKDSPSASVSTCDTSLLVE